MLFPIEIVLAVLSIAISLPWNGCGEGLLSAASFFSVGFFSGDLVWLVNWASDGATPKIIKIAAKAATRVRLMNAFIERFLGNYLLGTAHCYQTGQEAQEFFERDFRERERGGDVQPGRATHEATLPEKSSYFVEADFSTGFPAFSQARNPGARSIK